MTEQVLVYTDAYGLKGTHWCEVLEVLEGTGSSYPIRVEIPGKGSGQYSYKELLGARGPKAATLLK